MMFFKLSRSSRVDRILLVSLSNIGDVVLTFPVIDALRAGFPRAQLHVIVGLKARGFFDGNPHIARTILFDKRMTWPQAWAWLGVLRQERFDLVVDLRNSLLPFLLRAGTVTRPHFSSGRMHMKDKHLARLQLVLERADSPPEPAAIVLSPEQRGAVRILLGGISGYAVVAPGAADPRKKWDEQHFLHAVRHLRSRGRQVVLVGDAGDDGAAGRILKAAGGGVLNLCGRTTLLELAGVIQDAALALTNDSGIMHLASYLDRPQVALFGPTDPFFYGPWSSRSIMLRKGLDMAAIAPEDVAAGLDQLL